MNDTAIFNFAGKTVLVTGAAKGIGADMADQITGQQLTVDGGIGLR